MDPLKFWQVFTPGGLPTYTYNPRENLGLEQKLVDAFDHSHKIAIVTGATKSGKTVLVKKVLKDRLFLWLDGASITSMDTFWDTLGSKLQASIAGKTIATTSKTSELSGELTGEANALLAKGTLKGGSKISQIGTSTNESQPIVSKQINVTQALKDQLPTVVIDDFHYIERDLQGAITRNLKPLIFDGLPVIYIAIPQRRFDVVKVEREMNHRVGHVEVPAWRVYELIEIPESGFPLLNVIPDLSVSRQLGSNANGSPHLVQEFCRSICRKNSFLKKEAATRTIDPNASYEQIFKSVAGDHGRSIFEKISDVPSQISGELYTVSATGNRINIYVAVLIALSGLPPNRPSVRIGDLHLMLQIILSDEPPSREQIIDVVRQMAKISSTDDSSVKVIDYESDEEKVHVTDPFFAFFLRWGKELFNR